MKDRLIYGFVKLENMFLLSDSKSPWDILSEDNDIKDINGVGLGSLGTTIRRWGVIACAIAALASLVGIIIVNNSRGLGERKENIIHKLVIILAIGSLVTIFDALKTLFDTSFGL